ncbi:Enkurin domain-containing protein 1 [Nowakowskiella sp. JEL0407]|nr:Enkurin domain-containing protein 1 [Nowakowskiella sp. JEL0407]
MEAKRNRVKLMSGNAVGDLLKPSRGIRDDILFSGGKPKDHSKENYKLIKKIESNLKLKQELDSKPPPAPFKLSKFDSVEAKVSSKRTSTNNSGTSTPQSLTNSQPKNFIQHNALLAKKSASNLKRNSLQIALSIESGSSGAGTPRQTKLGQIPQYLLQRKLEWAQQEREREKRLLEEKIPPGTILIPNTEQEQLLKQLRDLHANALALLSRFPITVETPKYKRKRAEVEKRVERLEALIEIYEKPVLYLSPEDHNENLEFIKL